jgi:hypothetical protein
MGVFQYLSFLQSRQIMLEPIVELGRPLQATIDPVFPDCDDKYKVLHRLILEAEQLSFSSDSS